MKKAAKKEKFVNFEQILEELTIWKYKFNKILKNEILVLMSFGGNNSNY